jgi:hypothetical protein
MINFAIAEMEAANQFAQLLNPRVDFATRYAFYYDKTNNVKTFYVRENDYNYTFTANFVLGGLLHQGEARDVQPLIESCKLQKQLGKLNSNISHLEIFLIVSNLRS